MPDYDGYCLSNVPSTILSMFGVQNGRTKLPRDAFGSADTDGAEKIVLMIFDGLGLPEWRRQEQRGFFGAMTRGGHVRPITTVFPSTTAAALTSVATGLTPQEHGLIEWFLYLKEADMTILSLPFTPLGGKGSDELRARVSPEILFEGKPVFETLREQGIDTYSFLSRYVTYGGYSGIMHKASEVNPFSTSADLSVALRRKLEEVRGPAFFYVYWSNIDNIEHSYGPNTEEAFLEASTVSNSLQEGLLAKLDHSVAAKTVFLATADHGQILSDSRNAIMLDGYPRLVDSLARSSHHRMILPWGSPRDVYLRLKEEVEAETREYLSEVLGSNANVLSTDEAFDTGIFGRGQPASTFRDRVGNTTILPTETKCIWYRYPEVEPPKLMGQHGGMHPDEMTIPLAAARASSLL
jgi:predicted AlkP superfamily pyrophosphatase or phosphodiesterase